MTMEDIYNCIVLSVRKSFLFPLFPHVNACLMKMLVSNVLKREEMLWKMT